MWVELSQDREVNGKQRQAGDAVNVTKAIGERLIAASLANRIIKKPDNRIVAPPSNRGVQRFAEHKVFGRD